MTIKKKSSKKVDEVFEQIMGMFSGKNKISAKPSQHFCQDYTQISYELFTMKEVLGELSDVELLTILDDVTGQGVFLGEEYNAIVTKFNSNYEITDSDKAKLDNLYTTLYTEMGYSV